MIERGSPPTMLGGGCLGKRQAQECERRAGARGASSQSR